jgi:hypothetical protein
MFWPARGTHAARLRAQRAGAACEALCRRFGARLGGASFGRATPFPSRPACLTWVRALARARRGGERWCWRATGKGLGPASPSRVIRAAAFASRSPTARTSPARGGGGGHGPVRNHVGRVSGETASGTVPRRPPRSLWLWASTAKGAASPRREALAAFGPRRLSDYPRGAERPSCRRRLSEVHPLARRECHSDVILRLIELDGSSNLEATGP